MDRLSDAAIEIINTLHRERIDYNSEYLPLIDAVNRLSAYEDTGLEPEEIDMLQSNKLLDDQERRLLFAYESIGSIDHVRELVQAEADKRLVVHGRWNRPFLSGTKRKNPFCYCTNCAYPVQPKRRTKYCPNCGAKMDLED